MTTLLEDWCAFCQGEIAFDKSHFIGLLKGHNSEKELTAIMGYLPRSVALVQAAKMVISSGNISTYLLPAGVAEQQFLKELGRRWLRGMERASTILGDDEIAGICRNASVELVDDGRLQGAQAKDSPNAWFFDLVSDSVLENLAPNTEVVHALLEAFYGLSADYFIAWYMAAPLIDLDLDLSAYFDLWRNGGRCVLAGDALYVNQRSL